MNDFVVKIDPAVCTKNDRDPSASKLIEAAHHYGTVQSLDTVLTSVEAKYKMEIASMKSAHEETVKSLLTQLESQKAKDLELNEYERNMVLAHRANSEKEATAYKAEIQMRDEQLKTVKVEAEQRAAAIKNLFGW